MSAEDWRLHLAGKKSVLDMEMIMLPKNLAVGPVSKLLLRPYGDHGVIAEVDDWSTDRVDLPFCEDRRVVVITLAHVVVFLSPFGRYLGGC